MTSKKALKIISIGCFLLCCSVIFKPEFYIYELFHKIPHFDILLPELKTYIFICVACGINLSILIFYSSILPEENARTMLKGVSISFGLMTVFGICDLVTAFFGQDLVISDTIYTSFVVVTLGAFGISEAGKAFGK